MPQKEKINRLKIVLAEKEITQKDFAESLAVTPHTISRICNNDTQPSLRLLKKMAVILGIDIRDLLIPTTAK
ncbi:MAG: helix-turn-helix transcriptional regulator [Bacteroidota bacterium]